MSLENVEIMRVLPCIVDPKKIRFWVDSSQDVSEILPYLNAIMEGVIYNHRGRTLTIKKEGRLITIHPKMIAGGQILDIEDARKILDWLKGLINDCYEKRDSITPNYEAQGQLNALDIYKLLPGTNCRRCGGLTCLAFATKLGQGDKNIMACPPLFTPEFAEKRQALLELLKSVGLVAPSVFVKEEGSR